MSQNLANTTARRDNSHGFKGATRGNGAWIAQITFKGKRLFLGKFSTPQEANAAYAEKARELFGDFARS